MDRVSENSASVSQWLLSLRHGSAEAAEKLWNRYFSQIVSLANRQLPSHQKRVADGEDVALNVLDTLIRGATNGQFPHLHDRRDLWCLLLAITKQKTIDLQRRESCSKRGGGYVRNEAFLGGSNGFMTLDELCGEEPTPEFLTSLNEEHQRLMSLLRDDVLRRIATETLEGYTTKEISVHLGISIRAVQRKLNVIRANWAHEF
jgi:DNA-directed RNA polymerase specialized sigma24 family protein